MKSMPVLLWHAFQQAISLEKIHTPLKTNTSVVSEIAKNSDTVELDGKIEAVGAQLNRLTSKISQFILPGKFGQQSGRSGYRPTGQMGKSNSNFKHLVCRVCRKRGILRTNVIQ